MSLEAPDAPRSRGIFFNQRLDQLTKVRRGASAALYQIIGRAGRGRTLRLYHLSPQTSYRRDNWHCARPAKDSDEHAAPPRRAPRSRRRERGRPIRTAGAYSAARPGRRNSGTGAALVGVGWAHAVAAIIKKAPAQERGRAPQPPAPRAPGPQAWPARLEHGTIQAVTRHRHHQYFISERKFPIETGWAPGAPPTAAGSADKPPGGKRGRTACRMPRTAPGRRVRSGAACRRRRGARGRGRGRPRTAVARPS